MIRIEIGMEMDRESQTETGKVYTQIRMKINTGMKMRMDINTVMKIGMEMGI